jgi:hypothetical protein
MSSNYANCEYLRALTEQEDDRVSNAQGQRLCCASRWRLDPFMQRIVWCLALWFCAVALSYGAEDATPTKIYKNTELAKTPPMGWNSWNTFACNINEQLIRETTDAMVSSGMRDAGYLYVNIDDCWHGERDENGFIQADANVLRQA